MQSVSAINLLYYLNLFLCELFINPFHIYIYIYFTHKILSYYQLSVLIGKRGIVCDIFVTLCHHFSQLWNNFLLEGLWINRCFILFNDTCAAELYVRDAIATCFD